MKIIKNTFAKSKKTQSSLLSESDKLYLKKGTYVPTHSVEDAGDHYKVSFFVYKKHTDHKKQVLTTSQKGIDLIKKFEGFRSKPYYCASDVLTIGYGSTTNVTPTMTVTINEAEELLKEDLVRFEESVRDNVKVEINQNQFDALVSFAFNVGCGAFEDSTLLKKLNSKKYKEASEEFSRWVNGANGKLEGLVKRRQEEQALFNK